MDDEKSLGVASGLNVGIFGCVLLFLLFMLLYFTFWPLLKSIVAVFI